jgi:hypothetical protein
MWFGNYDHVTFKTLLTLKFDIIELVSPFDNGVWIGATDREKEGSFKWVIGNGGPISHDWAPGQPDDYLGGQDCLMLMHNGTFDDNLCTSEKVYMCEKQ